MGGKTDAPKFDKKGRRINAEPRTPEAEILEPEEAVEIESIEPERAGQDKRKHRATQKNRDMVETMAAYGTDDFIIAEVLSINLADLRHYYRKQLMVGEAKATSQVAAKVHQQALKGCTKSQRMWLFGRARWAAKTEVDHRLLLADTGPADKPKQFKDVESAAKQYKTMIKNLGIERK